MGGQALLLGLLRIGTTRVFPGGGVGIEYGALLKTAARPDILGPHIQEAAAYLNSLDVDMLFVPGMSGYPVGAMYAQASGIPAVLLKKQKPQSDGDYAPGAFIIPSYTGDGDVVISADLEAVRDIVAGVIERKVIGASGGEGRIDITLRCAGADDVIDKGAMAGAITERAPSFCAAAIEAAIGELQTKLSRPISCHVEFVAWVTPLIKTYNGAVDYLQSTFGITPFSGVAISSVHLDPPAIGVEDAGVFAFRAS